MANWCYNTLAFEAEAGIIEELRLFFIGMAVKEIEQELGQLPLGYHGDTGYFFEIDVDQDRVCYMTKWAPNLEVAVFIAAQYKADFIYNYEELAMGIFGEAQYRAGVLTDVFLESEDFCNYSYNEDAENYTFEGEYYNSDYEILDILLERKKAKVNSGKRQG